ncbi:MAG: dihydropteroate synthase [Acidimicrobiales bacterium]|nr:dihydropteroate synthase [Acidimicrobiales bacterium]
MRLNFIEKYTYIDKKVESEKWKFDLGNSSYDLSQRVLIMAILNRTKDSFVDHGSYFAFDQFLKKAEGHVKDGADILDIGGVKAGPGDAVSQEEELERVIPAVIALKERFDLPISVDTWNATVIDESFRAGALLGNDISGFSDPMYIESAKKHGGSLVATHIRLRPRVMDPSPTYDSVVDSVTTFLESKIELAQDLGVDRSRIVIDAGLDLGKTTPQSLELLRNTRRLIDSLSRPLLLSASYKTCLSDLYDLPVDQRGAISLSGVFWGVLNGARIVRVHDVRETKLGLLTLDRIIQRERKSWETR